MYDSDTFDIFPLTSSFANLLSIIGAILDCPVRLLHVKRYNHQYRGMAFWYSDASDFYRDIRR